MKSPTTGKRYVTLSAEGVRFCRVTPYEWKLIRGALRLDETDYLSPDQTGEMWKLLPQLWSAAGRTRLRGHLPAADRVDLFFRRAAGKAVRITSAT